MRPGAADLVRGWGLDVAGAVRRLAVLGLVGGLAFPVAADPVDRSPWPVPRPQADAGPLAPPQATVPDGDEAEPRGAPDDPVDSVVQGPAPAVPTTQLMASARAPGTSLRPLVRPAVPPDRQAGVTAPVSAPDTVPESASEPEIAPGQMAGAPPAPGAQAPRRGLFGGLLRPRDGPRAAQSAGRAGNGALAADRSLRPAPRPDGLVQNVRAAATRQTPGRVAQQGMPGALCGMPGLVGEQLQPLPGRIDGCGIAEPVRVRSVDGIALSTPATVNCQTARALQTWVAGSVVPTVGNTGGGVRSLRVVASYACRARNNRPGAQVSEHGRGNAIDIAGIGLADGSELTVLTDWRGGLGGRREGRILRALHAGACGPFGTVLGPDSDRFHQDHFHFDTASHRSGAYCR